MLHSLVVVHGHLKALPLQRPLEQGAHAAVVAKGAGLVLSQDGEPDPPGLVRRQRQQGLVVLDQGDGLVGALRRPAGMLLTANHRQRLRPGDDGTVPVLGMQVEAGLERQLAADGVVHPLQGDHAGLDVLPDAIHVLLGVLAEHDHIRTPHDSVGDGLPAGEGSSKSHHRSGVGGNEAVEAQLSTEQVRHQVLIGGAGQNVLVPDARAHLPGHGWL